MANTRSQIKRARQDERRRTRNKAVKSELRTLTRRFEELLRQGDSESALQAAREVGRKLDKAASKGVIHKNQAANKKSALFKRASTLTQE